MKLKNTIYLLLILVIANLTYQEYAGLNYFIISVLVSALSLTAFSGTIYQKLRHPQWWVAALLFMGNGFLIFYANTALPFLLYTLSLLYLIGVSANLYVSFPIAIVQAFQSQTTGFYYIFSDFINRIKGKKDASTSHKKASIKWLVYTLPIATALLFLKLYQTADVRFYELTKFINLDWISTAFIAFYILLIILLYGLYYIKPSERLATLDARLRNDIPFDYSDKTQRFFGIENERKIAISVLITLITLLFFYCFADIHFVTVDLLNSSGELDYSDLLHNGVYALIFSIVLVMLIVTFLFRGQLNFEKNKTLKWLVSTWLILNLLMITTTAIKNHVYISHFDLTYKRIGVYIYLFLCFSGIILTLIKILHIKSTWFLVQRLLLVFLMTFTVYSAINWDKTIVRHNLSNAPIEKIDFEYLISLGVNGYPELMAYYAENKTHPIIYNHPSVWRPLFSRYEYAQARIRREIESTTWRSISLSKTTLLHDLERFKLNY